MKRFLLTLAGILTVCLAASAQNVLVRGVVTDALTKETIPGAAILVNGAPSLTRTENMKLKWLPAPDLSASS